MAALMEIGKPAPNFSLPDLSGQVHHLSESLGKVVLLNFWSAECPWVERADRDLRPELRKWGKQVELISIASNIHEPLEMLQQSANERGLEQVLVDEGSKVADLYQAKTTPHFYVIDAQGILRYHGAYDDLTFRQRTPTRCYVCEAVEALLTGEVPPLDQAPPYGCTIVRNV
jgi:peroxiredoxin